MTAADRTVPGMTGRTIVVTGASSGIGAATANALARAGARVVLAVRDVAKGKRVAAGIRGETEVRHLELDDLASVRAFGAAWSGDLDILINNAGIMMVPEGRTVDGFERQIGTNHLGPFALTNLLLPHVTDRVITVSSNAHTRGHLVLDDLHWEHRPYDADRAYSDSKLANLLFTFELQRRLARAGGTRRAIAVHPGMVRTNLFGHATGVQATLISLLGRVLMQDPEHGAASTLFAAAGDLPGGSFVQPGGFAHLRGAPEVGRASGAAYDQGLARDLWDLSARLTGPYQTEEATSAASTPVQTTPAARSRAASVAP
jgi:NAD(P)-dependent dehydrogenase (short-subunit alcohol dehydrogenase family)